MGSEQKFWNGIAAKYVAQPVADEAAYQHKLNATQALLSPDMDLLEFGSGSGTTALIHAPFVRSIRGIDFSEEMVRIARGKAELAEVGNVQFEVSSIDEFDAEGKSFDAILGMSILHLLPNRAEVIKKVHRLLKPGGLFFSSTSCITSPLHRAAIPVMQFFGKAPYVGMFDAETLTAEMKAAGFTIEESWRPSKGAALFVVARK